VRRRRGVRTSAAKSSGLGAGQWHPGSSWANGYGSLPGDGRSNRSRSSANIGGLPFSPPGGRGSDLPQTRTDGAAAGGAHGPRRRGLQLMDAQLRPRNRSAYPKKELERPRQSSTTGRAVQLRPNPPRRRGPAGGGLNARLSRRHDLQKRFHHLRMPAAVAWSWRAISRTSTTSGAMAIGGGDHRRPGTRSASGVGRLDPPDGDDRRRRPSSPSSEEDRWHGTGLGGHPPGRGSCAPRRTARVPRYFRAGRAHEQPAHAPDALAVITTSRADGPRTATPELGLFRRRAGPATVDGERGLVRRVVRWSLRRQR
jgi:hypothetical protein